MNLSGSPLDFLAAFLGGIAVSFTPCVYPLIPISAGVIGARAGSSRLRGFGYSLLYVSGIAVTYSALGLLAGITGTLFGRVSSAPVAYIVAGAIIVIFGLYMAELVSIPLFNNIGKGVMPAKRGGLFSVFVLGLGSGLVISPCLTPVLGAILAYLAVKKEFLYGTVLLFSFSYGMGLTLILAGTFTSFVFGLLPKSGRWLVYVKRSCAFLLAGMGIYFIYIGLRRL